MPARRSILVTFVALGIAVLAILIAFVYPGVFVTHCTPNYTLMTAHGTRTYCSEEVTVTGGSATPGCTKGPPTTALLAGVYFSLRIVTTCLGPGGFYLNYSITEGSGTTGGLLFASSPPVTFLTSDGNAGLVWLTASSGDGPQHVLVFAI